MNEFKIKYLSKETIMKFEDLPYDVLGTYLENTYKDIREDFYKSEKYKNSVIDTYTSNKDLIEDTIDINKIINYFLNNGLSLEVMYLDYMNSLFNYIKKYKPSILENYEFIIKFNKIKKEIKNYINDFTDDYNKKYESGYFNKCIKKSVLPDIEQNVIKNMD